MTVNAEGALRAAAAHFEQRLAAVGTGDWHRRCCGEWTVREPQMELPADAGPAERLLHLTGR